MKDLAPDAVADAEASALDDQSTGGGRTRASSTLAPAPWPRGPWPRPDDRPVSGRPATPRRGPIATIGDITERILDRIAIGHRGALAIAGLGLMLILLVGVASPNAATVHVRGPLSVLPPLPTWWAYGLIETAIGLEAIGLVFLLRAHSRGWSPKPWKLFALSAAFIAVMVNLSPVGSSDSASYAAYGRMYDTGHDVYTQGPLSIGGPYARIVDIKWLGTSSVYGPIATWLQGLAALFGGDHPARTIWFLMVVNGAAFLLIGWLLIRCCKDTVRVTLLWTANPLLIQQLVAGGHLDTFVAGAAVCAVLLARRYVLAGVVVALGSGFKISSALVGGGFAVDRLEHRDWRGLTRFTTGAIVVFLVLYGFFGLHSLSPLSGASSMVSFASPWHAVTWMGSHLMGPNATKHLVQFCWPLALLILAAKLRKLTPEDASPLLRLQFALAFAWIIVAPWVLPWYSAPVWALVTLLPRTRMVGWLIAYSFLLAVLHASGGTPAGYYRNSLQDRIVRTATVPDGSGTGPPPPPPPGTSQWGPDSSRPAVSGGAIRSLALAV